MRILWIDPVGSDVFSRDMLNILSKARRPENQVDVVSLADERPKHLEYHAYKRLSFSGKGGAPTSIPNILQNQRSSLTH